MILGGMAAMALIFEATAAYLNQQRVNCTKEEHENVG
jgi:hypothetical protein